jgi:hypothetical protein
VTGELAKTFGSNLGGLKKDFQDIAQLQQQVQKLGSFPQSVYAGRGAGAAPNASDLAEAQKKLAQLREDTSALDKTLAQLATNGGAAQAAIAFQKLAAATGINIDQLPKYKAAAQGAASANTGLAKGFGDATANAQTMTNSLQSAVDAGEKLTDVWTQLNGAVLSSNKADLSALQAIDAVKQAFKDNGKEINKNTEGALKNKIAIGEAAKAAAEAAQTKYEETGSVSAANKVYDSYIGQLRKALSQAGLNKHQIDQLIGSYAKMPPTVSTTIKQPGIDAAKTKTQELWDKLKGVDGNWVAHLSMKGYAGVKGQLLDLMSAQYQLEHPNATKNQIAEDRREKGHFLAGGGAVSGPGGPKSDSIRAWLSNGEHVWTAAEVAALGGQQAMYALRRAIRSGKRVEYADPSLGFAGGGAVMPFPTDVSRTYIPKPVYSVPGGMGGGPGYKWMEKVVHAAFPGMPVYSDYRPGAITITGNKSYHGFGRAVDFAPSKPLAEWINLHFMKATKELITPWQSLNIHNGQRHTYSALVESIHTGSNAHDHWAMANGGVINEPVFGFGLRSGDTYSLGERGSETVTPGVHSGGSTTVVNVNLIAQLAAGANPAEHGRQIAHYLEQHFARGGEIRVNGRVLVGN